VTVEPSFLTLIRKIFDHGDEGEPLLADVVIFKFFETNFAAC